MTLQRRKPLIQSVQLRFQRLFRLGQLAIFPLQQAQSPFQLGTKCGGADVQLRHPLFQTFNFSPRFFQLGRQRLLFLLQRRDGRVLLADRLEDVLRLLFRRPKRLVLLFQLFRFRRRQRHLLFQFLNFGGLSRGRFFFDRRGSSGIAGGGRQIAGQFLLLFHQLVVFRFELLVLRLVLAGDASQLVRLFRRFGRVFDMFCTGGGHVRLVFGRFFFGATSLFLQFLLAGNQLRVDPLRLVELGRHLGLRLIHLIQQFLHLFLVRLELLDFISRRPAGSFLQGDRPRPPDAQLLLQRLVLCRKRLQLTRRFVVARPQRLQLRFQGDQFDSQFIQSADEADSFVPRHAALPPRAFLLAAFRARLIPGS